MGVCCDPLHQLAFNLPRFRYPFDVKDLPKNGIYLLFEKGEKGHGGDRIVRVGTHTGQGQLAQRLTHHFDRGYKDRNIFRKNIGRCFLYRENSPYLPVWDLAFRSRKAFEERGHFIDDDFQRSLEERISRYIQRHISFCVLEASDKEERLYWEAKIIATVSWCSQCGPSPHWLGSFSPKPKIRESGLWQVNELYKEPLTPRDVSLWMSRTGRESV